MKKGFVSHFLEQNRLHPDRGEVIVHIPAKSLSTRLPGKNVRPLNGVPLIGYSVMIANRLRGVDRVYMDTDSPELAEIAAGYGEIEHFQRPPELAREKSQLSDVFNRFMEHLVDRGVTPAAIITLYPTSPFRNLGRTQRLVDALAAYCKVYTGVAVRVEPGRAGASSGRTNRMCLPGSQRRQRRT